MTITLRTLTNSGDSTKGSPLTNAEIDQNFIDLGTNPKFKGTEGLKIPAGTTAQRAVAPQTGETRYNTDLNTTEVYNGTTWTAVGGSDALAKTLALIGL